MTQSATGGKPVRDVGALKRWLTRPELAAVAGAILVFAFFAVVAGDSGFLTTGGAASSVMLNNVIRRRAAEAR